VSRIIFLDGARLSVEETAPRYPAQDAFIFQHGMGGDTRQSLGYLGGQAPCRVVAIDARGHGNSCDVQAGDCRFDVAADDVIAVADQLQLPRFVVGGISLGAGTAINITVRCPERVSALVLCRPAWLDRPQDPWNRQVYEAIADVLESYDTPDAALQKFTSTTIYQQVLAISPAAAESLRHQITRHRAAANSAVLRGFPADRPTTSAATWVGITIPALVIGHRDDPFHPHAIAEAYAWAIPRAELITVPSKDVDSAQFAIQIRVGINDFLRNHAASRD
jgi:pimeloyl-ACP methyl ester carboxylesterase